MTPKEKAKDLIYKISAKYNNTTYEVVKKSDSYVDIMFAPDSEFWRECALITVDEILENINETFQGFLDADLVAYWQLVKKEMNNL